MQCSPNVLIEISFFIVAEGRVLNDRLPGLIQRSSLLQDQKDVFADVCYCYIPNILAERCNYIANFGYCHNVSSVFHLSVMRYYDETTKARITWFSLESSTMPRLLAR